MQRNFSYYLKVCGTFMERNAAAKNRLQRELHQVFSRYGYEDIETPGFEYFEVFSNEVGTIPSKDLYKFFVQRGKHTCPQT